MESNGLSPPPERTHKEKQFFLIYQNADLKAKAATDPLPALLRSNLPYSC